MENMRKTDQHNVNKECFKFAKFIYKCFKKENQISIINDIYGCSTFGNKLFLVLNSVKGINNKTSLINVYYNKATSLLLDSAKKFITINNEDVVMIYITFFDETLINMIYKKISSDFDEKIVKEKIIIFGKEYLKNLVKKNMVLWWNFGLEVTDDQQLIVNSYGNIEIEFKPLVSIFTKLNIYLSQNHLDELSKQNEIKFKSLLKTKKDNEIALFLGNGISIPFGADKWDTMSNNLTDFLSPLYVEDIDKVKNVIGNSTYTTTLLVKEVLNDEQFKNVLWYSLYRKYNPNLMHHDNTLIRSIVKIKSSLPETKLLTYNFDNFVELDYSAYKGCDCLYSKTKTSIEKHDNQVIHLHGLLPFDKSCPAKDIVLSSEEYYNEYKDGNWVKETQKATLENCLTLFVGSSMSDLYQMSIIKEVKDEKIVEETYESDQWSCFALVCVKGLSKKDIVAIYNYFYTKNISIIFTNDYYLMPEKLDMLFDEIM